MDSVSYEIFDKKINVKKYGTFGEQGTIIKSVNFSPDDKFLAAATDKGQILIYSM